MDRHELLATIRRGRQDLEAALAGLADEQMAEPVNGDWTRTDVVGHLGAWEDRTVRLFAILRGEREFDPEEPAEVDAFNAWSHERRRGRPLAEVRASEAAAWQAVVDLVERSDETDLFDTKRFPFLEGRPFADVVLENTSRHYPDHLDHLRPLA